VLRTGARIIRWVVGGVGEWVIAMWLRCHCKLNLKTFQFHSPGLKAVSSSFYLPSETINFNPLHQ